MSENRTVVYTPEAGSGSGSGMMAMLAPLKTNSFMLLFLLKKNREIEPPRI